MSDLEGADIDEIYCKKYAELCAQAHAKHCSDKSLTGKEPLTDRTLSTKGIKFGASSQPQVERFVMTQRLPSEIESVRAVEQLLKMARQASLRQDAASPGRGALMGMNAWDRHKHFVANYVKFYGGQPPADTNQTVKTDWDVLRESYRFIREEGDDAPGGWEVQLAQKYYRKLFREYAIADLSRYKEGKVGLRWRIEKEVVSGKGQFACGAKGCNEHGGLASFEVNFVYEEEGTAKAALVKLRLCPKHALQLNHQKNQLAIQAQQKQQLKKRSRETDLRGQKGKQHKSKRRQSSPDLRSNSKRRSLDDPETVMSSHGASKSATLTGDDAAVSRDDAVLFRDMFD